MTRGFEIVAVVLGVFFLAGITVGVLLVTVLPLIKARVKSLFKALRQRLHRDRANKGGSDWQEPPTPPEGDEKLPWWQDR